MIRTAIEIKKINDFLQLHGASNSFAGGTRQFYVMSASEPRLVGWYRHNDLDRALAQLDFYSETPYYTTKNSFFADKRGTKYLFSLDNIVIDLDAHSETFTARDYNYYCNQVLYALGEDKSGRIPQFNAVRSGRGLHLWIALDSFSAKLLPNYLIFCKIIAERVQAVCRDVGSPFSVDTTASSNAAGLIRLPYTYNASARRYAAFEKLTERRYTFEELQELCAINADAKGRIFEKQHGHRTTSSERDRSAYRPLNRKRKSFLETLVKDAPEQTGRRALLIFAYINAVYSLTENADYTRQAARAFNCLYSEPLAQSELDKQFNTVLRYGGIDFTVGTFFDFIQADALERLAYSNTATGREVLRAEARQLKAQRDEKILSMHRQGFSCRSIADEVGCNASTVSRFLKSIL